MSEIDDIAPHNCDVTYHNLDTISSKSVDLEDMIFIKIFRCLYNKTNNLSVVATPVLG